MKKVNFYIDGFNIYYAIESRRKNHKFKWLDLNAFCAQFISKKRDEELNKVYYFSAYEYWNQDKVHRHTLYVKALESIGIKYIQGKFKERDKHCKLCHGIFKGHEEKQTDVNIACKILEDVFLRKCNIAILVSGDSDLIQVVKTAKAINPSIKIGLIIPPGRTADELKSVVDFSIKARYEHLETQLPEKITLESGSVIERPTTWK